MDGELALTSNFLVDYYFEVKHLEVGVNAGMRDLDEEVLMKWLIYWLLQNHSV